MARAIWKGTLALGKASVPVKMYSAVQDRNIHFRLLHASDLVPVHQRIVRKSDGKEVPKEDRRKAFPVGEDTAVILQPEELERIEPETSREIDFCRLVGAGTLSDQWFDRPYYLGPDEDDVAYFALAEALVREEAIGIARWVMRRKRYVGALTATGGYLVLTTLRRADQVLSVQVDARGNAPDEKELKLAQALVDYVAADFDPAQWQDEYRERVMKLIEAKRRGEKVKVKAPRRKRSEGGLADQLRQSLASMSERKVA